MLEKYRHFDGRILLVRECGCGSHSIRLAGTVSLVDGNIVRIDIFLAVNNPCRNAEQCVSTSSSCLYRRKDAQFVHVVKHLGDGFRSHFHSLDRATSDMFTSHNAVVDSPTSFEVSICRVTI